MAVVIERVGHEQCLGWETLMVKDDDREEVRKCECREMMIGKVEEYWWQSTIWAMTVRYGWLSALMTGKGWENANAIWDHLSDDWLWREWWQAMAGFWWQGRGGEVAVDLHQGGDRRRPGRAFRRQRWISSLIKPALAERWLGRCFHRNQKIYAAQVKRDTQLNGSHQIRPDSSMELNSIGWISCAPVNDRTRDLLLGFGRFGRWPFGFYKDLFWNFTIGQYT